MKAATPLTGRRSECPATLEPCQRQQVTLNALTDFGRTMNLVASSKLQEKAQQASGLATTEDIVLATDQAFYNALQAEALLKVAQQTVTTRQSVEHQISELTKEQLKSSLDLSFADVSVAGQAAATRCRRIMSIPPIARSAILGFDKQVQYELSEDDQQQLPAPPPDVDVLVSTALQQRPDASVSLRWPTSGQKFRKAQRDLPEQPISALGIAGVSPVRPDCFGGCFPIILFPAGMERSGST